MASCKMILGLIVIIKLFTTSSAGCFGGGSSSSNSRIQPRGNVRVTKGHGLLTAGRAGITCPNEIGPVCHGEVIYVKGIEDGFLDFAKTFELHEHQVITYVRVSDPEYDPRFGGQGGRIDMLEGGPGFSSVTLRFRSDEDNGVRKRVDLHCLEPAHQA